MHHMRFSPFNKAKHLFNPGVFPVVQDVINLSGNARQQKQLLFCSESSGKKRWSCRFMRSTQCQSSSIGHAHYVAEQNRRWARELLQIQFIYLAALS